MSNVTATSLRLLHCYSKPGTNAGVIKNMNHFSFAKNETLSRHMCTYLQVHLDMVLVSGGHSVSACRERATVSAAANNDLLRYGGGGENVVTLSLTLVFVCSACRVCECSGAANRPEVHHWPGCHDPPVDWAVQRSHILWFLFRQCHVLR